MNRDPVPHHPLVQRLLDARQVTDDLFAIVKPDYLYERPIRERHRVVFYIGHLEAFDRNLLDQRLFDLPAFAPELDQLFAFGIDPVDGGFPTDQPGDWPSLAAVREYATRARRQIDTALDELGNPAHDEAAVQLLNVAIEHRLMHAETLAYMLHQLPLAQKNHRVARAGGDERGAARRVVVDGQRAGRHGRARHAARGRPLRLG
ncbi:hypothetical protein OKW28_001308 [Paraburkholderia sp. 40]